MLLLVHQLYAGVCSIKTVQHSIFYGFAMTSLFALTKWLTRGLSEISLHKLCR